MSKLRAYGDQKHAASMRGIKFLLTYEQWFNIWKTSGHFHEKGRLKHQYCMARIGDRGPYKIGNVRIITSGENRAEQKLSAKTRALMRAAKLGKKLSPEHRANIARGNTGKRMSQAAIEKIRFSHLGEKNPMAKLTNKQAIKIIALHKNGQSYISLARKFGVSSSLVSMIVRGLRRANSI